VRPLMVKQLILMYAECTLSLGKMTCLMVMERTGYFADVAGGSMKAV